MSDLPESPPLARNLMEKVYRGVYGIFEKPVIWFRETVVEPNQKQYPWYHQKFRRVPTIDQCYTDDPVCYYEANMQYRRDRMVDSAILTILKQRFEDCVMYEQPDHLTQCKDVLQQYEDSTTSWFTKYGDLGTYHNVKAAYMKQKHRMIWERRYGPVGTGMTPKACKPKIKKTVT